MKLRPATDVQLLKAQFALERLREARSFLLYADTPNALARVRSCIKSTEGAIRHLSRRVRWESAP